MLGSTVAMAQWGECINTSGFRLISSTENLSYRFAITVLVTGLNSCQPNQTM